VKRTPESDAPQPLAAAGGVEQSTPGVRDPYEALDDLMVLVEALCPSWPPREKFRADGRWLL
jgi:hypothetical protein